MNFDQPTSASAKNGTGEILQIASTLSALAYAASQVHESGDYMHAIVPQGFKLEDISRAVEKMQPSPRRKAGTVLLKDVPSLLAYCADQAMPASGYIYADPDGRKITAVFNDHRAALLPGWRDHRAEFKAEFTPEFATWLNNSKQPKDQTQFAEFIEDNFVDIAEPAAATLLEVASTLQAKTAINFASAKRLDNGQAQLTYTETIDARAGSSGALEIPREFVIGVKIFKNSAVGYRIKARLKYRLAAGAVKFWYELDRPERSIEDAFGDYVKELTDKSGYTVLIGMPG
jgi:uncharacterized protein YfdQ (DUF2303 family)